ncbi:hypothetical protein D3C81_1496840 [compost metagenome]
MVHAVDQGQFGIGPGRLEQLRVLATDLHIVTALHNQCGHRQAGEVGCRVLAEQGNQVGLHTGAKDHLQWVRDIGVGLAGLERRDQLQSARQQRAGQARLELFGQYLVNGPCTAGQGDHSLGIDLGGGKAGDQCAFTVAQKDQRPQARVGLQLAAPGHGVGNIAVDTEFAFVGLGGIALGHTTLVVAHAGNAVFRQQQGQALEAVVLARWIVAITVRGAGTCNQ